MILCRFISRLSGCKVNNVGRLILGRIVSRASDLKECSKKLYVVLRSLVLDLSKRMLSDNLFHMFSVSSLNVKSIEDLLASK